MYEERNEIIVLRWNDNSVVKLGSPVAEFSVSICSKPKFVCSSDDGIPRLLITENDNNSYKSNIFKNRMMWILYHFKIEFAANTFLEVKGK